MKHLSIAVLTVVTFFALLVTINPLHAAEPLPFDIEEWADKRVASILERIEAEKNDRETKVCCDAYGRCTTVEVHVPCPAGTW